MNLHHRLSPAQLDALAAGGGGPDAVAVLQAGQLSKRTVALMTIMDLAQQASPEAWDDLNQAYEVLVRAQHRAPESVNAFLGHPYVGIWAARCLRRLRGTGGDTCPLAVEVSQLAAVAAVAGILGGVRFDLPVRLRQGTVLLPSLGLASFPDADPWGDARLTYDGLRTVISAGDQRVELPPDPFQSAPGWLGLRRLTSRPPGAEISVELIDLGPTRDGAESTHLTRLSTAAADQWQEVFDRAWRLLVAHHPDRAASIRSGLVAIAVPAPDGSGIPLRSGSIRNGFGLFLAAFNPSPEWFAETIVHEFQHSKLTALSDLAPLHEGTGDLVYYAPWRQDARHLEGLLQGAYAFLGITDYWAVMRRDLAGEDRRQADFQLARWRHQVAGAIEVLRGSGRLTEMGERVVERMRMTATSWSDEVVDPLAQELADQVMADTRLCWLLANRHPDPAAVARLADAWLAGHPIPITPGQVASVTAHDGVSRGSERYKLLSTRLLGPARLAELSASPAARAQAGVEAATEADLAYATGDYRRAVRLASAEVREASQQPGADLVKRWAGLALAVAAAGEAGAAEQVLTRTPEVVAALHREVTGATGSPPDPLALAAWLADEPARSLT